MYIYLCFLPNFRITKCIESPSQKTRFFKRHNFPFSEFFDPHQSFSYQWIECLLPDNIKDVLFIPKTMTYSELYKSTDNLSDEMNNKTKHISKTKLAMSCSSTINFQISNFITFSHVESFSILLHLVMYSHFYLCNRWCWFSHPL